MPRPRADVGPPGWLAALLAGGALLLALPPSGGGLARLAHEPALQGRSRRLLGLVAGRADAAPWPRRLVLSAAAAAAMCSTAQFGLAAAPSWLWWGWPLLTLAGLVSSGWLEPAQVQRRRQRLVLDAPQGLELFAACLAAGMPPRHACAAVVKAFDEGPLAEDLGEVLRAVELGVPESSAWQSLAPHPQLGPAALDLARSLESGTSQVSVLRAHAVAAREQRRSALQQAARAVGVRSVLPLTTCFLPAFLLVGVVPTVASAVLQAFGGS